MKKLLVMLMLAAITTATTAQEFDTLKVGCYITDTTEIPFKSVHWVYTPRKINKKKFKKSLVVFDTTKFEYNSWWCPSCCDSIIAKVVIPKNKLPLSGLATRQEDWIDTLRVDVEYFKQIPVIVIRREWYLVQPNETGNLNTKYIDQYLSWAERTNKKFNLNIRFKLRIVTGVSAPKWAKDKVGSFVLSKGDVMEGKDSVCIRWWEPSFVSVWQNLQTKLAEKYDTNELLAEVVMSATSSRSGEAFIRTVNDKSKPDYLNAGYTTAKDLASIYSCTNAMQPWKHTCIGMSISPFQHFSATEKVNEETKTSKEVADYLSWLFRERAVIGNNGLRTAAGHNGQDWQPGGIMYDLGEYFISMKIKYGANIFYQTAAVERQNSTLVETLDAGLMLGTSLIELPGNQREILSTLKREELAAYNTAVSANK